MDEYTIATEEEITKRAEDLVNSIIDKTNGARWAVLDEARVLSRAAMIVEEMEEAKKESTVYH